MKLKKLHFLFIIAIICLTLSNAIAQKKSVKANKPVPKEVTITLVRYPYT